MSRNPDFEPTGERLAKSSPSQSLPLYFLLLFICLCGNKVKPLESTRDLKLKSFEKLEVLPLNYGRSLKFTICWAGVRGNPGPGHLALAPSPHSPLWESDIHYPEVNSHQTQCREEPPITYVRCILIAMAGIIGEVNTKYFRFSQQSGAENKLSASFMILWSQRAYNVFKIAVLPHHKQH